MARISNARQRLAVAPLTVPSMAGVLRRTMPRKNGMGAVDYAGLIEEAQIFGVLSNRQFRKLMLKHRRALLEADREPLSPQMENIYRNEWGDSLVTDRLRRQYWFGWEALTRLALELELGAKYRTFREQRDGPTISSSELGPSGSALSCKAK
jgi:hypothetical protein